VSLRDRLRAWILTEQELEALRATIWKNEWERTWYAIKRTRELLDRLKVFNVAEWDQADPVVRLYFGSHPPSAKLLRYCIDDEKAHLDVLERKLRRLEAHGLREPQDGFGRY